MALTEFQRFSYKLLGRVVSERMDVRKVQEDLSSARMGIRAEAYLSYAIVLSAIMAVVGLVLGVVTVFAVLPVVGIAPGAVAYAAISTVPVLMGFGTFVAMASTPGSKAKQRAKEIDLKIPYALNYVAAMASAGVNVDEIFRALGEQTIYGECATEAEWIFRDMAYFGKDSITAMKRAIARTPSDKWSEFLQGAITTVTSGGDLQSYFYNKAQRYMWENRQDQKQFVEMMGLMAETYVTAAVAGPLFLIVMMAIMALLGGEGPSTLYLIIYMLLPVANFGFVFGLQAMTPEV